MAFPLKTMIHEYARNRELDRKPSHDPRSRKTHLSFISILSWILVTIILYSSNLHLLWSVWPSTAASKTSPTPNSSFGLATSHLIWTSCGHRVYCANLSVPLDHLNAFDSRTVSIAITKYTATNSASGQKPKSLIINPGGPGGSGSRSTYVLGPILDEILKGQYDVIGFDPRGVNLTTPSVDCITDPATRLEHQRLTSATSPSRNIHDVGLWDSVSQLVAKECEANSESDILQFVNTPSVARDMAAIVDALHAEKTQSVSYWGFSYGSTLGAVFSSMFPNKMHKMILDGIASPFHSREIFEWGFASLSSVNEVAQGYFDVCDQVGERRCPLTTHGGFNAKHGFNTLLEMLYERPLPVSSGTQAGLVTHYSYKNLFYETLYRPEAWRDFADITVDLLNGDGSSLLAATEFGTRELRSVDSCIAVLCSDAMPATNYSLSSWKTYVQNMTATSLVSGDFRSLLTLPCRHWKALPNERWLGDFQYVKLDLPILLIGNTYDPATPIKSARELQALMGATNAILLEQRSYGHVSGSAVSSCTYKAVLDYLLEARLPQNGAICEIDDTDFEEYFPKEEASGFVESPFRRFSRLLLNEVISRPV